MQVADREYAVYREPAPDLAALLRPPSWHADSLCLEYPDLNWFPHPAADVSAQEAVCGRCAVRGECLEAGMDESDGFWGGLTSRARRRLRLTGRVVERLTA